MVRTGRIIKKGLDNLCWVCQKPTARDYTPSIVIGVGCRRCATRAKAKAEVKLKINVEVFGVK